MASLRRIGDIGRRGVRVHRQSGLILKPGEQGQPRHHWRGVALSAVAAAAAAAAALAAWVAVGVISGIGILRPWGGCLGFAIRGFAVSVVLEGQVIALNAVILGIRRISDQCG